MKPELRTSLTVNQWPREVRYFWVLLWGYLDDHGYGLDEPKLIKPDCFPMDDDLTPDDIDKWLDLMASTVLADGEPAPICRFQANGRRYLHATRWAEHQRPQHPAMPRYPACTRSHEMFMRASGESHETVMSSANGNGKVAGQPASGDSHETLRKPQESLTPEQVVEQGAGSREQGAGSARARPAATLLGNSLLEEHKRRIRPSLPREVARRVGEQIDLLLDDPEIKPQEISEALGRLRAKPKLGPGVLPSLVNEVRQERAHSGRSPAGGHRPYRNPADQSVYDEELAP